MGVVKTKAWISAFRLRTLPLAFSCIITGTAIAHAYGFFDGLTFALAILTTLFLQVLSNLANDYGDAEKGTDNENRIGPERAIQSGIISPASMKKGMVVFVLLSLFSGLSLVFYATKDNNFLLPLAFVLLGIGAIIAAIKYTAGKGAYGYKGLGDLFVFLFFGIVGVGGTFFLYAKTWDLKILLPSMTIGLFSSAVLNLNNMRDIHNDEASGKRTLVVKIGLKNAVKYHLVILVLGMLSAIFFVLSEPFKLINLLFLISFLPLLLHLKKVVKTATPKDFDPELKKVALTTFLFSLLFWISIIQ